MQDQQAQLDPRALEARIHSSLDQQAQKDPQAQQAGRDLLGPKVYPSSALLASLGQLVPLGRPVTQALLGR